MAEKKEPDVKALLAEIKGLKAECETKTQIIKKLGKAHDMLRAKCLKLESELRKIADSVSAK